MTLIDGYYELLHPMFLEIPKTNVQQATRIEQIILPSSIMFFESSGSLGSNNTCRCTDKGHMRSLLHDEVTKNDNSNEGYKKVRLY